MKVEGINRKSIILGLLLGIIITVGIFFYLNWKKKYDIPMVYIEGGTFTMGKADVKYAEPVHQVKISNFKISKYKVTQDEWQELMGYNPSSEKSSRYPVTNISWYDIQEYIQKLNLRTFKKYRLPTEAEWEYVAGGKSHNEWVDDENSPYTKEKEGWYSDVGQNGINSFGVTDLGSKLNEFCNDWFAENYGKYSINPTINPKGPNNGEYKVIKGGYSTSSGKLLVAERSYNSPTESSYPISFRLAE